MVSVRTLRGTVNSSPRSLNPDSVSLGCRLAGSDTSGRSERKGAWPRAHFAVFLSYFLGGFASGPVGQGLRSPMKLAEINIHPGRQ